MQQVSCAPSARFLARCNVLNRFRESKHLPPARDRPLIWLATWPPPPFSPADVIVELSGLKTLATAVSVKSLQRLPVENMIRLYSRRPSPARLQRFSSIVGTLGHDAANIAKDRTPTGNCTGPVIVNHTVSHLLIPRNANAWKGCVPLNRDVREPSTVGRICATFLRELSPIMVWSGEFWTHWPCLQQAENAI